jgi:hypothetical protein
MFGWRKDNSLSPVQAKPGDGIQHKHNPPTARVSRYAGLIKFFLLMILMVVFLLLGRAMVNHRFSRGGWVN